MDKIKQFEPLFGEWYAESFIGAGSFGRVYKIYREELGNRFYSALKYISLPADSGEIRQLRADGMNEQSIATYYSTLARDISSETTLMNQLRGNTNIVSFEDSRIVPKPEGIGYDIFIRMELLDSLTDRMVSEQLTADEVARLGADICSALVLCAKSGIIHRDIKPDNIFISPNGDYKLGDFGIARQLEKTATFMSRKGTYNYMAPEVYKGEKYGAGCDIYSLGLVMYRLLNNGRLPFLPAAPQIITPGDRENSIIRRMKGEPLPSPCNADEKLSEIVLKACAYDPQDRYASAEEMRNSLFAYMRSASIDGTVSDRIVPIFEEAETDRTMAPINGQNDVILPEDAVDRTQSIFEEPTGSAAEDEAGLPQPLLVEQGSSVQIADDNEQTQSLFGDAKTKNDEKDEDPFAVPVPVLIHPKEKEAPHETEKHEPRRNEENNSVTPAKACVPTNITPQKKNGNESFAARSFAEPPENERKKRPSLFIGIAAAVVAALFGILALTGVFGKGENSHTVTNGTAVPTGYVVIVTAEPTPTAVPTMTPMPTAVPTVTPTPTPDPVVAFTDPTFESAFRSQYGFSGYVHSSDVLNMTALSLPNKGLKNITDVAMFKNLDFLDLTGNNISDISPLSGLTKLEYLLIAKNDIADVSALSGLVQLEELYINDNKKITSISALSGLTNLTYLDAGRLKINDISALSGLTNLRGLLVGFNEITDISVVANFKKLELLYIADNKIRDVSAIAELNNLKKLWIKGNPLTEDQISWLKSQLPNCTIYRNDY